MRQHIGVALGIVTSLEDPQGEGRIKVKFTSFLDGGPESPWQPSLRRWLGAVAACSSCL